MAKSLEKALKSAETKVSSELKASQREEKEEKKADREYGEREKRLFGKKLELAKEIFAWGDEFRQRRLFKRLLRAIEESFISPDDSLEINSTSTWGHEQETYPGTGQWSHIYLLKDGGFGYVRGFRWHGASAPVIYKTPKELANGLNYDYLVGLKQNLAPKKLEKYLAGNLE